MRRRFLILSLGISTLLWFVTGALAEKRVALIIANSDYQHVRDLPNPGNDAAAVAKLLQTIGFADSDVTVLRDLGYDAMRRAVLNFARAADGADVALIYFAGHGLGSGVNYLIPVDAELQFERDLPGEAMSQRMLEDAVKGARGLKLVILDACRNDPSGGRMAGIGGATRNVGERGLGRVEPDGGVLVLYSAKHGTVAQDGPPGGNSPFATALVKNFGERGKDIRFVLGGVRDDVMSATAGGQEPYHYGSLGRESVFLVKPDTQSDANAQTQQKPSSEQTEPVKTPLPDYEKGRDGCIILSGKITRPILVAPGMRFCSRTGLDNAIIRSVKRDSITYSVNGGYEISCNTRELCQFNWDKAPLFNVRVQIENANKLKYVGYIIDKQ